MISPCRIGLHTFVSRDMIALSAGGAEAVKRPRQCVRCGVFKKIKTAPKT